MPDPLLDELGDGPEPYDKMERYKDFRAVFLTDQGRKVLREILNLGGYMKSSAPRSNYEPHETMFREGARALSINILDIVNTEPRERETGRPIPKPLERYRHG